MSPRKRRKKPHRTLTKGYGREVTGGGGASKRQEVSEKPSRGRAVKRKETYFMSK